jgi:antitoxin (DNA-binding transcriptional repressor) of toxin-antitoxin stability system
LDLNWGRELKLDHRFAQAATRGQTSAGGTRKAWPNLKKEHFVCMIVTATELAKACKGVLDRVLHGGEVLEIQRHGKIVAVIQPCAGATRAEIVRLLRGRGFNTKDAAEMKAAADGASNVIGYANEYGDRRTDGG